MSTQTLSLDEMLQEKQRDVSALQRQRGDLHAIYQRARDPETGAPRITPGDAAELRNGEENAARLQQRVDDWSLKINQARNAEALRRLETEPQDRPRLFSADNHAPPHPAIEGGISGQVSPAIKAQLASLGDALINLPEFKSWSRHNRGVIGTDISLAQFWSSVKAPIASTGLTAYERPPGVYGINQQRLTVADLLARGETGATSIRYLRETSPRTSSITAVAEDGTKPEQVFAFSEVDAPVQKIAGYTKMTEEMATDFPAARSFVNEQLGFEVLKQEEYQLLQGSGTPPNLRGILNTSGIQTQALVGGENNADTVLRGITKVQSIAFMEPDGIILHPNNWLAIRLLKTTTGEYIYAPPHLVGPNTLWGLPVVVTTAITAGTGLITTRRAAQVFYREGLRIEMTNSDQDDFVRNRITLRGEIREALAVYYPAGFCSLTSLV